MDRLSRGQSTATADEPSWVYKISYTIAIVLFLSILPMMIWFFEPKDAVKTSPTDTGVVENSSLDDYIRRVYNHHQDRKYAEAVAASLMAIELGPTSAAAYNELCASYNHLKQWADAVAACRTALELDPNFQLAKNNLARAQQGIGK